MSRTARRGRVAVLGLKIRHAHFDEARRANAEYTLVLLDFGLLMWQIHGVSGHD